MYGCMLGDVFFSVLYPGTRIKPHCGPTNVRHRMHLVLSILSSESSLGGRGGGTPVIRVNRGENMVDRKEEGNSTVDVHWKAGKAFVFDDSLVPEVDFYHDGGDSIGDN